jgi:hypothetical protein
MVNSIVSVLIGVFKIKYQVSIDSSLVEQATAYSYWQLHQSRTTAIPGLFRVQDFLYPVLLDKLLAKLCETLPWQPETTESGLEAYPNRQKINWLPDSVIEETHMVFANITAAVNRKFARKNRFLSISVWRDDPGYCIAPHTDTELIDIAIQIYLEPGRPELGTEFHLDPHTVKIPYQPNTGYIMDNQAQILHSMPTPVPEFQRRLSVYAIYTAQ